ncbi:MAG: ABC transporter ATP-binding protein [Gemmatimonadota bacterium]|nr:ABC transporter ATP-binding protein [Gemmatimonadota bacterium]
MIEFRGAGKVYKSRLGKSVRALEDFSLRAERGEVLGIAGPNGAGKSTLIAIALGYLTPSEGKVTLDGRSPREFIESNGIAYMSELVSIPPKWSVESAITRYALLAGIPSSRMSARRDESIERLGLAEHRSKTIKQLSKGNLQRLGLAQALLRDDAIVILDEPTHGLDPVWTQRFRDLIHELRTPDRTILVASHNLDELERVADRVAIIDRGRLQRIVATGETSSRVASSYHISVLRGAEYIAEVFTDARDLGNGAFEVGASDVESLNRAIGALLERGVLLTAVTPTYSSLETQFREAVGEVTR